MSRSTSSVEMSEAIQISSNSTSSSISSFIDFDVVELFIFYSRNLSRSMSIFNVVVHVVKMSYDEDFNLNKRFFVKESRSISFVSEFVANENHRRKKKQRKASKKIKSQSIVEMFNETLEKYDTLIFIRQVLKTNKMKIN